MQSKSAYYTNERIEGIKERLRRFNSSKLSLSQTSEEMININLPHDMMENENNSTHSENRSTNEVNNAVRVDNSKMPFMSSSSSSSSLSPSSLFPLLPTSISTLLSSSESKQTILETPLTSSQEKSVSRTSNTQKREGYDDMQTPSTSTVSETRRDYKKNDTNSTKETNKKQKEDKSYKHEQYDNKIQETDKNNCHNKNNNINNNNNNNNKTNKIRESVPNNCSEHNELKEMKYNDYEQDMESREQEIENVKNNVHRKSVADSLRAFMRAVAQVENDVKESSLHSETKNTRKHANEYYKKDHHDHLHNNNSNNNSKNIKNNVANENNRNAKINNNISATTDNNNIINNRKSTIENGLHKCDTSVEYKEEKEELPYCEQEWADAFNEQNTIKANKKKIYRDDHIHKRRKKLSELTEEERNERQQTNELSNSTHKLSSVTTKEFHYQQEEELEEEEEKKWEESEQRQFTNSSEELEAAELLLTRLRQLANEKVNASTEEKTVQTRTTESKSGNEAKSENKSEHVNVNTQNIEERVFESFIRANKGQVDLQRNRKTMREQYEQETHKEQETNSPLTRINLLQQQQQEQQQQHHLQCHKYREEDDAMESNINNNSNLCRNECRSTMESTHSSYNSSTTTSMSSDPFTNHNPFENASSLSTESLSTLSESDLSSNECEVMLAKMTATSSSESSSLSASSEENTNKQQLLFSGQEQNVNKNVINNYTDIKMKANTLEEVLTNATSKECNTCVEENKKINVNKSTVSNMHCYFTERIAAYMEKLKLFATATATATTNTTNTKKKKSNAYINHSSSVDNADNNISLQSSQTELYEDLFNHLEVAETVIANAHASVERLARLHHNTSLPHSLPHVEELEKLQRRREALLQEEAPLRHGAAPIEMTLTSIQEKYNKPFQQHLNALSFLYANTSLQTKTILSRRGGVEASRLLCQERERDLNERRRASEIISHEIKELETELQTRQAALREREAKYKERLREHGERDERIQHYIDGVEELGMTISTWLRILEDRDVQLRKKEDKLARVRADLTRRIEDIQVCKNVTRKYKPQLVNIINISATATNTSSVSKLQSLRPPTPTPPTSYNMAFSERSTQ